MKTPINESTLKNLLRSAGAPVLPTSARAAAPALILVTMLEENEKTGEQSLVVSHGIDERTGKFVCLPGEHPKDLGAVYCDDMREWVIYDYPPTPHEQAQPAPSEEKPREPHVDWFSQEYDSPSM